MSHIATNDQYSTIYYGVTKDFVEDGKFCQGGEIIMEKVAHFVA